MEVVNQDLIVLEATEIAREGNRINGLHDSSQSGAHFVIELELVLSLEEKGALVQQAQIAIADS